MVVSEVGVEVVVVSEAAVVVVEVVSEEVTIYFLLTNILFRSHKRQITVLDYILQ